nr:immunoglobulin heavy chain junction region [Macaca mulatta]
CARENTGYYLGRFEVW